jgi:transcriptional regulator with XRE-family HTH domain
VFGIINLMHIAQRFELLLDTYRRPDGSRWAGQQLEEATGGVVPRAYFVNLRKGRIGSPGYEKMGAIAKAMGFPPAAWFDENVGDGMSPGPDHEGRGLAARVGHLFGAVRNPKTGKPYTNAEVARMSVGDLTVEDVESIRTGTISNPTVSQVAALASVLGVAPSYLLDRGEPVFGRELVEALRDGAVRETALEISHLPERERQLVLGIVRQIGDQEAAASG